MLIASDLKFMESSPTQGLWVRSDVLPDGAYAVTINLGQDRIWVLDRPGALAYAVTCVEAAQRAEYDAAVLAQLTRGLGLPVQAAAQMLASIRPDRRPLDDEATTPLAFIPGVNSDGMAFLMIQLDGEPWGQLSPLELRAHAMIVLEAPAAADLDAGYLQAMLAMEIPEATARGAVGDLANWRR